MFSRRCAENTRKVCGTNDMPNNVPIKVIVIVSHVKTPDVEMKGSNGLCNRERQSDVNRSDASAVEKERQRDNREKRSLSIDSTAVTKCVTRDNHCRNMMMNNIWMVDVYES